MVRRRSTVSAAVAALVLAAGLAGTVSAAPVERTRSTIECLGTSATLIMHPGDSAIVQWDISTEDVRNSPSFIIKSLTANVFVGGEPVGTFSASFGKKTGFGEPLQCTFEVHNGAVDVYGTSELVQL